MDPTHRWDPQRLHAIIQNKIYFVYDIVRTYMKVCEVNENKAEHLPFYETQINFVSLLF